MTRNFLNAIAPFALLSAVLLAVPAVAQDAVADKASEIADTAAKVVQSGAAAVTGIMPTKEPAKPLHSELLDNAPLPDDFMMGDKKAPVTVVEYASLTCPHCAHFHEAVIPALDRDYIKTGKVRYILRPYPLNEPALKAAELLDCIGQKEGAGRYYTFAKVLFESQDKWAFDTDYMKPLETFATVGGVSKEMFEKCTSDTDREKKILKIRKSGTDELKISHTPYIFVNNMAYEGKHDDKAFAAYLDKVLAEKKAK